MNRKKISALLAFTVLGTQAFESAVHAQDQETGYDGTTSIAEVNQYFSLDGTGVELVVEEVYVESGSYV